MNDNPYSIEIKFKNKNYNLKIHVNSKNEYDLEISSKEEITEKDFLYLKKYLISEGYIDNVFKWKKD